ncbi:MAG: hypothetical protein HY958_05915 [Bacteroidia bacterium]|nr:hypothetical protein [Bacteroidia bacterium]
MFFFKIFNNNSPVVFIMMPLFLILLWIKNFTTGSYTVIPFDNIQMPLYSAIQGLTFKNTYIAIFIGFLLIAIQVILFIRLNVKYIFIENRSFLPAFIFIFISGSFIQLQRIHPALCANIFFLWAFDKLLSTYKRNNTFAAVFDASFLISIGSLFYFNMFYFLVFLWIGFLVIKPFSFSEWLISIIGFITPYFFLISYYFLTDKLYYFYEMIHNNASARNSILFWDFSYYLFYGFLLFLALVSTLYFLQGINVKKIVIRRYFTILLLLILFLVTAYILLKSASVELLTMIAMPISYLIAYYLITIRKKWIKEVWVAIFLILLFLIQFFN